jgi:hypothetical protein
MLRRAAVVWVGFCAAAVSADLKAVDSLSWNQTESLQLGEALEQPESDELEIARVRLAECLERDCDPLAAAPAGPNWWDTLQVFGGLDGSKQPQDVGINANFGGRAAVNLGIPLWDEVGLGLQVGTALTWSDNAVRVMGAVDGTDQRMQAYTTLGIFQRPDESFEWALAWDFLYEDYYYDDISLSQLRARTAFAVSDRDKIGAWGTWSADKSQATFAGTPVTLSPINQASLFWSHLWKSGVEMEMWGGVAFGHGEVVHVFPGNPAIDTAPLFGAMIHVPLNDRVALYGQGNFIMPADSGTVDSYLGFIVYLDKVQRGRYSRYSPVLDVAGSTSFAVNLSR